MRIFTILFFIILCVHISKGQTPDQKPKKPLKNKVHPLPKAEDFNTWDLGLTAGLTYPYTDISASGKRNFGIGLDVTKFLSHTFALQTRFFHASLSGVDVNEPNYSFNTTINYDITLNGIFQFGNISFLKRNTSLAFYGSFGIGLINYSPEVSTDGGVSYNTGIYSQYSQPLVIKDYEPTTDLLIPIGVGIKYRISNDYSVSAEYSFRTTNSDKLDGFYKLLSSKDNYSFFGVGFIYHLGKNQKVLEWENPLQTVYNDLYNLKSKMDMLSKDTDQDGVPDMYDHDPNTPQGVKVYGDGTAVDSDGDGIPDWEDVEPFSGKNAKVDIFGREIGKIDRPVIIGDTLTNKKANDNKTDSAGGTYENVLVKRMEKDEATKKENPSVGIGVIKSIDSSQVKNEKPGEATNPSIEKNNLNSVTPDTLNKTIHGDSIQYSDYKNLPSIYFASGESKITSNQNKTLEYIAHVLMNNPEINFNVIGVCDNIGSLEFNLALSKKRAEAVKRYLENNFNINPVRLSFNTIGTYEPISGNNQLNRRVDIKVRN